MDIVKELEAELVEKKDWPEFEAGDTIAVTYSIKEGDKQRQQTFTGTVIQRRGTGSTATFTIRKVSNNVGVERVFPITSPFLEEIKVLKNGSVRRARIFYLRDRQGKAARIKERKYFGTKEDKDAAKAEKSAKKAEAKKTEAAKKASDSAKATSDKEVKAEPKAETAPKAEPKKEAKKPEAKAEAKPEAKKEKAKPEEKKADDQPKKEDDK